MKIQESARDRTDKTDRTRFREWTRMCRTSTVVFEPPGPGAKIVRGSPRLWTVAVHLPPEVFEDGFTASLYQETVSLPSALYFGETTETVVREFYDRIGSMWGALFAPAEIETGNRNTPTLANPFLKPGAIALEILTLLQRYAPAAGISQRHDAIKALQAARRHIEVLVGDSPFAENGRVPASEVYSREFRNYAVSFLRQGHGRVFDDANRKLNKTEVQQIIFGEMAQYQSGVRRAGAGSPDMLRDWDRGKGLMNPVAEYDLRLPAVMSPHHFAQNVRRTFQSIAAVARPFVGSGV